MLDFVLEIVENCWMKSVSSFSNIVFKSFVIQSRKHLGLFSTELRDTMDICLGALSAHAFMT